MVKSVQQPRPVKWTNRSVCAVNQCERRFNQTPPCFLEKTFDLESLRWSSGFTHRLWYWWCPDNRWKGSHGTYWLVLYLYTCCVSCHCKALMWYKCENQISWECVGVCLCVNVCNMYTWNRELTSSTPLLQLLLLQPITHTHMQTHTHTYQ